MWRCRRACCKGFETFKKSMRTLSSKVLGHKACRRFGGCLPAVAVDPLACMAAAKIGK